MPDGKLRRNVDLRLVSYALSVLKESPNNPELAVVARFLAASTLQLAGGYKALIDTCKASSESEAIRKSMEPEQARRASVMFEAIAESLEEYRKGALQELMELIVVFARGAMDDMEAKHGLTVWASSIGIDTAPLLIHDEDEDDLPEIVEIDEPIKRRVHKPRQRAARTSYERDRTEDIVREAIATGIETIRVKLVGGRVEVVGTHPRRSTVHIRWLRCSMADAEKMVAILNEELRKLRSTEPRRSP